MKKKVTNKASAEEAISSEKKAQRLAEALRQNLLKRKTQKRAREAVKENS